MNDVDFLPLEYRKKHVQRQSQPWQAAASVAIIILVVVAAFTQAYRRHAVQDQLAILAPAYEAALNQANRLAQIQTQLKAVKAGAELYTYLHHPWPRSQLLAALVTPLPKEITLQQVQILRRAAPTVPSAADAAPLDKKAEEDAQKALSPADRDLAKFRARLDPMQTVVILTGTTTESALLHRYIGDLDATDIFDKAELDCSSSDPGKGATVHFRSVLLVRPGYGQPGGPTDPDKKDLAQTNARKS